MSLPQYSDLELAINSLVSEFHKAADDAPTMNTTQFQTMISKQLPAFAKVRAMTSQLTVQSQHTSHTPQKAQNRGIKLYIRH